jgi:hypothetical protein
MEVGVNQKPGWASYDFCQRAPTITSHDKLRSSLGNLQINLCYQLLCIKTVETGIADLPNSEPGMECAPRTNMRQALLGKKLS